MKKLLLFFTVNIITLNSTQLLTGCFGVNPLKKKQKKPAISDNEDNEKVKSVNLNNLNINDVLYFDVFTKAEVIDQLMKKIEKVSLVEVEKEDLDFIFSSDYEENKDVNFILTIQSKGNNTYIYGEKTFKINVSKVVFLNNLNMSTLIIDVLTSKDEVIAKIMKQINEKVSLQSNDLEFIFPSNFATDKPEEYYIQVKPRYENGNVKNEKYIRIRFVERFDLSQLHLNLISLDVDDASKTIIIDRIMNQIKQQFTIDLFKLDFSFPDNYVENKVATFTVKIKPQWNYTDRIKGEAVCIVNIINKIDLSRLNIYNSIFDISVSKQDIIKKIVDQIETQTTLKSTDLNFEFSKSYQEHVEGNFSLIVTPKNEKLDLIKGKNNIWFKVVNKFDLTMLKFNNLVFDLNTAKQEIIDYITWEIKKQIQITNNIDLDFIFDANYDENKEGNYALTIKPKDDNRIIGEKSIVISIIDKFDLKKLTIPFFTFDVSESKQDIIDKIMTTIRSQSSIETNELKFNFDQSFEANKEGNFIISIHPKSPTSKVKGDATAIINVVKKLYLSKLNLNSLTFNLSTTKDQIIDKIMEKIKEQLPISKYDLDFIFTPNYDPNVIGKYNVVIKPNNINNKVKVIDGEKTVEIIINQFDLSQLNLPTVMIEINQTQAQIETIIKDKIKAVNSNIDSNELKIEFTSSFDPNKIDKHIVKIRPINNTVKTVKNSFDLKIYIIPNKTKLFQFPDINKFVGSLLVLKNQTMLVAYEGSNMIYQLNQDGTHSSKKDPIIKVNSAGPVKTMLELQDGTILIGTESGKILQYDFSNNNLTEVLKLPVTIRTLILLENNTFLASGVGYDKNNNQTYTKIYSFDLKKTANNLQETVNFNEKSVSSMLQLEDKTILVGCIDGSIYHLNEQGYFKSTDPIEKLQGLVSSLVHLENGNLLALTNQGYFYYLNANGKKKIDEPFIIEQANIGYQILAVVDEDTILAVNDKGIVYQLQHGFKK